MELKVNSIAIPEKITFNFEELKAEISEKTSYYASLVYTEENIKTAKTDRAALNKLKTSLNDERIRLEKEYLAPFQTFKAQIAELVGIIDKPCQVIDKQIKDFEEEQKQKKKDKIEEKFKELNNFDFLTFDKIFNPKWLNATTSEASILQEIQTRILNTKIDLETLSKLPDFSFEAIETYKRTLDVNVAISEGMRLAEIQKRKEEEQKRRAEEEARKAAEQAAEQIKIEEPEERTCPDPEVKTEEPKRSWVTFAAKLTVTEAKALKVYFDYNHIEFKAIQ